MLALADFSNDQGESYPSLKKIAQKARLSVRGVCKILDRRQAAGEVRRDRSRGGKNKRTRYFMKLPNSEQHSENDIQRTAYSEPDDTQTVNGGSHAINRHRTVNKDVSKKRSRRDQQKSDPRAKEFLEWFPLEYQRRLGRPYCVSWAKEIKLLKVLLKTLDPPTLKRCAVVLLETEDPFLSSTGRGIPILANQINKLAGMIDPPGAIPPQATPPLPEPLDYRESANHG